MIDDGGDPYICGLRIFLQCTDIGAYFLFGGCHYRSIIVKEEVVNILKMFLRIIMFYTCFINKYKDKWRLTLIP